MMSRLIDKVDTFDQIHMGILQDAALIANDDLRIPIELRGSGHIFREANNQSEKGGLCLEIEASVIAYINTLPEKNEYTTILHEIARNAIMEAIASNKEAFAGLIIADARNGKNYFERFGKGVPQKATWENLSWDI